MWDTDGAKRAPALLSRSGSEPARPPAGTYGGVGRAVFPVFSVPLFPGTEVRVLAVIGEVIAGRSVALRGKENPRCRFITAPTRTPRNSVSFFLFLRKLHFCLTKTFPPVTEFQTGSLLAGYLTDG